MSKFRLSSAELNAYQELDLEEEQEEKIAGHKHFDDEMSFSSSGHKKTKRTAAKRSIDAILHKEE